MTNETTTNSHSGATTSYITGHTVVTFQDRYRSHTLRKGLESMPASASPLDSISDSDYELEGGACGDGDVGQGKDTAVTLALAKQDCDEHMEGMAELYETMRQRPLIVRAFPISEEEEETDDVSLSGTVKTVHLIRHGQGFHNLLADLAHAQGRTWKQFVSSPDNPYTMPEVLDCPLTERGRCQAMQLRTSIQKLPTPPQLVVSSPHCRALQTAVLAFEHLLSHPSKEDGHCGRQQKPVVPFVVHELVREETGVHLCDQRRSTSRQALEFPQFDFALLLTEQDVMFEKDRRETIEQVGERIYQFLEWLHLRPETHVGISSHSAWLLTLMHGVCECPDTQLKEWFQTGEMRSVKFQFVQQES